MFNKRFVQKSNAVLAGFVVLFILALSFQSLEARKNNYSRGDGTGRLSELKEKLNLTDDQVTKLTPILKNHHSQVKAIKDKYAEAGPDDRQKMRDEVKAIFDKTYAEVGKVISSEQLAKFKEIIKQNQNFGSSKGKGKSQGNGRRNRNNN